jgi:hypothetical protein
MRLGGKYRFWLRRPQVPWGVFRMLAKRINLIQKLIGRLSDLTFTCIRHAANPPKSSPSGQKIWSTHNVLRIDAPIAHQELQSSSALPQCVDIS